MASARDEVYDVIIVGSGWSGLLTCKHAKAERLSVLVLEKREGIGGVWRYTEDTHVTTVMESTKTSSSRSVTEISDFPMPDTFAEFPRQDQILDYLHKYATKFDLLRHIRFNAAVSTIKKDGTEWVVMAKDNSEFRARNLVISTGVHQKPNMKLEATLLRNFTGSIVHSGALKRFNPQHGGKRIMIIGGGETSSDVIDEYYPNVASIVWSIPRGQHFFRKYGKLLPYRKPQALDKASSRALKFISPHCKSKPGLGWICRWTTSGSLTAYEGHGIPEFRSDVPFLHSFINKQAHVLDLIDYKKLIPKGAIEKVNGKTVVFKDGSSHEVDVIILCTGYEVEFPFLPPDHKESPLIERYKYVFSVKDPSLAFVGYVRPMIGSIPGIAEMQARWVSRVFSGRVRLTDGPAMVRSIADDKVFWDNYFHGTSQRISTLVEGYTYVDDIAHLSGCYPDYWALFKRNPAGALRAYFAPFNGCSFLLNEPEKEEEALRTLRKHSADTFNPIHLLLILLLRFLLFDWFLEKLGRVKYSMQLSPTFKALKEYKVVKVLDYVWTIPKRCVFDNKTKLE